jgi:hypothetical protein
MAYNYKVVELREKMLGGKMSGEKLENLRNEHAALGWQLKASHPSKSRVASAQVASRGCSSRSSARPARRPQVGDTGKGP